MKSVTNAPITVTRKTAAARSWLPTIANNPVAKATTRPSTAMSNDPLIHRLSVNVSPPSCPKMTDTIMATKLSTPNVNEARHHRPAVLDGTMSRVKRDFVSRELVSMT